MHKVCEMWVTCVCKGVGRATFSKTTDIDFVPHKGLVFGMVAADFVVKKVIYEAADSLHIEFEDFEVSDLEDYTSLLEDLSSTIGWKFEGQSTIK